MSAFFLRRYIGIPPRYFGNQRPSVLKISVEPTPNPKTFVYSTPRAIPRNVITQISQHGSISDIHQITESSIAVTFFQSEAVLPSVRDEVRSELMDLLTSANTGVIDVDIPVENNRPTFDPDTPAGRVDAVIAERIRPGVNADGGDVHLVELTDDGVAIVRMMGSCNGCPSSDATLKNAIEKTLLFFCAEDVKEVRQAPSDSQTIDSADVLSEITSSAGLDLPSVISHNHVGQPLDKPLNGIDFPVVSLFAKKIDSKMISRVKFASTVTIPKDAKSSMDVWVTCADCSAKKRLEDVDQLVRDARQRDSKVDRVAVIICPACAVVVREV